MKANVQVIDLFCGIGGMTHGLIKSGLNVIAGYDIDESCRYAYEVNNDSKFINSDISNLTGNSLAKLYSDKTIKVLVGCAPCQPFSKHTHKVKNRNEDKKWGLLYEFGRLIKELEPEIVSMENVPQIEKQNVFIHFVEILEKLGYHVFTKTVLTANYGVPQSRRRKVLLASKNGDIELIEPLYNKKNFLTVRKTIGNIESLNDGEISKSDKLHKASKLGKKNKLRIQESKPGGTWRDWPIELRANCHLKENGKTYSSVYARMEWDKLAPTITTQFYNYGTGRFGHPEQDRALSLREGALLQTFPLDYKFIDPDNEIKFGKLGVHIGNAVPVELGAAIGKSIIKHVEEFYE